MSISYAVFCLSSPTFCYILSLHDALPICHQRETLPAPASQRQILLLGSTDHLGHIGFLRVHHRRLAAYRDRLSSRLQWQRDVDCQRLSHLRSEEHTSELQSHVNLVCRLLLIVAHILLHSIPTRRSSDLSSARNSPSAGQPAADSPAG